MQSHKQTWAKVNAPVDEAIAGLVGALSTFHQLQTIESCQGDAQEADGQRGAWICFQYGNSWDEDPWRDLAEFVLGDFGPALAELVHDAASVSLQVTEAGRIQGELVVKPGMIVMVTEAVERLALDR